MANNPTKQRAEGNGPHSVRPASPSNGASSARRSQMSAARAAAARLAQVMASHTSADDDDDDPLDNSFERQSTPPFSTPPFGLGSGDPSSPVTRFPGFSTARDQSTRFPRDQSPRIRASFNNSTFSEVSALRISNNVQAARPARPREISASQGTKSFRLPSATLPVATRVGDSDILGSDIPLPRERRLVSDSRTLLLTDTKGDGRRGEAALRDEIDLLEEDNEILLNKLRDVEEQLRDRESRNKELEKQVASLGDGISMEARLLTKKEAALRSREAALKAVQEQTNGGKDVEIAALRLEIETARDELGSASERASIAEKEVQGLRNVTRRMILSHDEMEEMVLKRCWLARYWGLAARHGVLPGIASAKHEHWSAFAPLPLEVVLSAGQREESNHRSTTPSTRDLNDIAVEGHVEGMLAVEKGLRELALLKVEEAVMQAIARHQHLGSGLSPEQVEDVQFKNAWLMYFWRRAKSFQVEADIADERLSYWVSRSNVPPTSHDVVNVESGLLELHKLGVEEQLWETSRRDVVAHANQKSGLEEEE